MTAAAAGGAIRLDTGEGGDHGGSDGNDGRQERDGRQGRTATLTFNRPPLNILDLAALLELRGAIERLAAMPALTLVFLRGSGGRAFSAGTAVQDHAPERVDAMLEAIHGAVRALRALPAITVAAVEGLCLGGGMEIATSCDLVVATEDASFGQPEVNLGCFPPVATAFYPGRLGSGRTLDLVLTGRRLDGATAERWGLVQRLVPAGSLDAACQVLAEELGGKSAPVVRLIKRAVAAGRQLPPDQALAECERLYREELATLADMREGVEAFVGKRSPRWQHR